MTIIYPFIAAALYGMAYILTQKVLESFNALTYMAFNVFFGALAWLIVIGGIYYFKGETFTLPEANRFKHFALMFGISICGATGWAFSVYAIKDISALYTAFGEVSYPLFVLLFGLVLYGLSYLNWQTVLGGGLVMIGSLIMILGQLNKT